MFCPCHPVYSKSTFQSFGHRFDSRYGSANSLFLVEGLISVSRDYSIARSISMTNYMKSNKKLLPYSFPHFATMQCEKGSIIFVFALHVATLYAARESAYQNHTTVSRDSALVRQKQKRESVLSENRRYLSPLATTNNTV